MITWKQREVLKIKSLCRVVYTPMYSSNHILGYSADKGYYYEIHIASDIPNEDARQAVLLHELGHAYLGHLDNVDIKKELQDIKDIFDKKHKNFENIRHYGGPMSFLNICMDLEINSAILTYANIEAIDQIVTCCTPERFNVPVLSSFRDYYEPLIDRLKNEGTEEKQGNPFSCSEEEKAINSISSISDIPQRIDSEEVGDELKEELSVESYGWSNESLPDESRSSLVMSIEEAFDLEEYSPESLANLGLPRRIPQDEIIKNFLLSIVSHNLLRKQDALRLYNRGVRENSFGILYSSYKRVPKLTTQKLGILIDVSGSMRTGDLLKAIETIKNIRSLIQGESKIVTWNSSLVEEYNLNSIPESIRASGSTDIAAGLGYMNAYQFEDIVIFSDFFTNQSTLLQEALQCKGRLYSIRQESPGFDHFTREANCWDKYLKANKKVITINSSE